MDISEKEEVRIERKEIVAAGENLISEERVVNFSDTVFAFAATLLVLKIDLGGILPDQITSSFFAVVYKNNMGFCYRRNYCVEQIVSI